MPPMSEEQTVLPPCEAGLTQVQAASAGGCDPGGEPRAGRGRAATGALGPQDAGRFAQPGAGEFEEETVNGLPVLAEVHPVTRGAAESPAVAGVLPAVQVAAAAATGFVAGAAVLALVHSRAARRSRRVARRPRRGDSAEVLPILGTRSFLVDVHILGHPEA
jgi:hypothetical protein